MTPPSPGKQPNPNRIPPVQRPSGESVPDILIPLSIQFIQPFDQDPKPSDPTNIPTLSSPPKPSPPKPTLETLEEFINREFRINPPNKPRPKPPTSTHRNPQQIITFYN